MAVDRSLIKLLLVLFAVTMAVLWLFAVIVTFAVPAWTPPAGLLAIALAALL